MLNGKKVVITYGTYDLLHFGHRALLERAKALGDYLIVGVTSDAFDRERGKLNVSQSLSERLTAIKETGIPDLVIAEEYRGQKIDDIGKYGVDVFAIGSDWEGKFDYLKRYCAVEYLPRTEGVSSTDLRAEKEQVIRVSFVGASRVTARMMREIRHVSGVEVVGLFPLENEDGKLFCKKEGFDPAFLWDDEKALFAVSDAVCINVTINRRFKLIESALEADCHVLCESPLFSSVDEGNYLFKLADKHGKVLMEALKTLYLPAFERLKVLLASGVIGEIKDIRASISHVYGELAHGDKYQGSFYDLASSVLMPTTIILGPNPLDSRLICAFEGGFCTWTKCDLLYPTASATLCAGRGMKTEGDMVITGTQGYIYVPAPWWNIEYFEVREEDLRKTKKHYYGYSGEGFCYELFEFLRRARSKNSGRDDRVPAQSREDIMFATELVERFSKGEVIRLEKDSYGFGGGETVSGR